MLSRIYAACGALFSFAVAEEAIAITPLPRLKKGGSLLPAENAKARSFEDGEITGFWSRIDETLDGRPDPHTRSSSSRSPPCGLARFSACDGATSDLSATFVDRRGGGERVRGSGLVTLPGHEERSDARDASLASGASVGG